MNRARTYAGVKGNYVGELCVAAGGRARDLRACCIFDCVRWWRRRRFNPARRIKSRKSRRPRFGKHGNAGAWNERFGNAGAGRDNAAARQHADTFADEHTSWEWPDNSP